MCITPRDTSSDELAYAQWNTARHISVNLLSLLLLLHVVPGATLPWVTDLSVRVPPRALRRGG